MKYFKNASKQLFAYESDGSQDASIPEGQTEITFTEFEAMRNPAPTLAELKASALAEVFALRAVFFPTLAGMQSEALALGNTADAVAIAALQKGCREIMQTDLSACATKEQINARLTLAWKGLLTAAPASVVAAFRALKK